MIGSPGTGEQHFERRTSTSSTPAMRMPRGVARDAARRAGARQRRWMSTTLSVLSSSLSALARPTRPMASPKPIAAYRSVGRRVIQLVRRSSRSARRARHRAAAPDAPSSLSSISWPSEHVLFLALLAEPLLDLVLGARRLDDREPVERRPRARLVDEHLDDVAVLELEVERDDLAVDLRADAVVADVGVHLIGEVERRRAGGQREHVALGREDEHLRLEQIELEVLHEHARIAHVVLPLEQRAQPGELLLEAVALARLLYSASARRCRTRSVRCISSVRICTSSGSPPGPTTVVCSDWYMLGLGIAM